MKLLFVCNNMHIGGIQRALLNLLYEIEDKYDITLFLFYPTGKYMDSLPPNIKVITGNRFTRILGMSQAEASKKGFLTKIWRGMWVSVTRIFGSKVAYNVLCKFQRLPKRYDCAISYMQNSGFRIFYGGCNEFVINSTKANKKISFVHCDYRNYYGNNEYNRKYYKKFDLVACVSGSCKKVFDEVCDFDEKKSIAVHNCYNFEEMKVRANEFKAAYTQGKINIFTSARISEEKGIFRMICIFTNLKKRGCKFIWRIAGGGALYEKAYKMSIECGLEDDIVFLGMKSNPYPYFKTADLLLVPSYDEAAPMVFGEAMTFGLPVFSTDTTSAKELVENKNIGFVCQNNDKKIEEGLGYLLMHPEMIREKRYNIKCDNTEAIKEFERIIR